MTRDGSRMTYCRNGSFCIILKNTISLRKHNIISMYSLHFIFNLYHYSYLCIILLLYLKVGLFSYCPKSLNMASTALCGTAHYPLQLCLLPLLPSSLCQHRVSDMNFSWFPNLLGSLLTSLRAVLFFYISKYTSVQYSAFQFNLIITFQEPLWVSLGAFCSLFDCSLDSSFKPLIVQLNCQLYLLA